MKFILLEFKEYNPVYDTKNKILHLYGKVKVKDLIALKILLKTTNTEIKDIRIN